MRLTRWGNRARENGVSSQRKGTTENCIIVGSFLHSRFVWSCLGCPQEVKFGSVTRIQLSWKPLSQLDYALDKSQLWCEHLHCGLGMVTLHCMFCKTNEQGTHKSVGGVGLESWSWALQRNVWAVQQSCQANIPRRMRNIRTPQTHVSTYQGTIMRTRCCSHLVAVETTCWWTSDVFLQCSWDWTSSMASCCG